MEVANPKLHFITNDIFYNNQGNWQHEELNRHFRKHAMDYTTQYQQQPQPQPQAAAETYDPSQTQAYYAYYQQQQQQQYQYYPSQDYAPIHPPGVPIPPDPTHFQVQHDAYYSQGIELQSNLMTTDAGQGIVQPQIGQSAYRGGGRRGGRPFWVGGRSVGRGRGRGRGVGKHLPRHVAASSSVPSAAVPGQTPSTIPGQVAGAPSRPPPPKAWCELCRVDCNTQEILEQHKNGKKHKRNLKTHADLQNLNKRIAGQQNIQFPDTGSQPEVIQPEKVEESSEKQPPQEILPSQTLDGTASNETELQKITVGSAEEPQRRSRDQFDARGRGFKRKTRGGRGGKYMRTNEGPRRPVESKPKEVIPFICELCNVKCESQVVFDSHLVGKKHLANVKRFQGHQALYGEAALQSLYPPNFNTPSSSVIPQVQQGINDPQVVLAQLLTYVLSQAQAQAQAPAPAHGLLAEQLPGLLAAQLPGLAGMLAPAPAPAPGSSQETQYQQDFQTRGSMATTEAGSKNTVIVDAHGQKQSVDTESEAPEAVGIETEAKTGISSSEGKIAGLSQDNLVMASPEKPDNVASSSKCENESAVEAVQQQFGKGLDDSEYVQNPQLESEDGPDSPEEAVQAQNNE